MKVPLLKPRFRFVAIVFWIAIAVATVVLNGGRTGDLEPPALMLLGAAFAGWAVALLLVELSPAVRSQVIASEAAYEAAAVRRLSSFVTSAGAAGLLLWHACQ